MSIAEAPVRTSKGRTIRVPVSFYLDLDGYVMMCEQAKAAGVSLSEWLRESTRRQLAQTGGAHDRSK